MLDSAEVRWIKSTANDLNNLLQVIAESGELLAELCRDNPAAERYLSMMRDSVNRAALVTRGLSEKAGGTPGDQPPSTATAHEEAPHPVRTPAPPKVEIHNPDGQRELILVVDDEEFVTLLASKVLSNAGYRVVTAKDGFQALAIYRQLKDQIALIILDFTMPVMDGSDVFAELQQINPRVPVVLSSGFAEQERLGAMLARGLRGFIPKPYTNQKLLDQVRQTLDGLQTERER